ncbi:zinc finger protein-like, partial [Tropilaelaps mercedesae]
MSKCQLDQTELFYTRSLYEKGLLEFSARSELEQLNCDALEEHSLAYGPDPHEDRQPVEGDSLKADPDDSAEDSVATDDESLDQRLEEQLNEATPQCPRCSKSFLDQTTFATHVANCRVQCRQPCPECGLPFATRLQKDRHMREAHGVANQWVCPYCDGGHFYTEKIRDFHIYKSHPSSLEHAERMRLEEKYAQPCGMCDFVSWSKKSLQVHRRTEHFGVQWSIYCPACACGVVDRQHLERHVQQRHDQDPV